ncbi:MAG: hypothetical protein HY064_06080 [Bacteroidetes bacterium]|nr:hypothetical protein [Bacteroidota bacterium]
MKKLSLVIAFAAFSALALSAQDGTKPKSKSKSSSTTTAAPAPADNRASTGTATASTAPKNTVPAKKGGSKLVRVKSTPAKPIEPTNAPKNLR